MAENRHGTVTLAVKAALVRDGRLLIIQRSSTDRSAPGTWEFAGGHVELGEQPVQALLREIEEETGLAATVHQPLYVTSFMRGPLRQVFIATYRATAAPGQVRLSFEHQDHLWATRSQALALLDASIARDLQDFGALDLLPLDD